jgi:hypothetical protein
MGEAMVQLDALVAAGADQKRFRFPLPLVFWLRQMRRQSMLQA